MKLLTQGDDYGFTKAVTLGIDDAISNGILRNTGVFANRPTAALAAELSKKHPEACYGIDFNLVAGRPVCDPKELPTITDENGNFHKSGYYVMQEKFRTAEGQAELFPMEEVRKEIMAQYNRFIELFGHKPGYLHGHSILVENANIVIREIAEKENIPYSMTFLNEIGAKGIMAIAQNPTPGGKTFEPNYQLAKDTTEMVLAQKDTILNNEISYIICHPGFVDDDLFKLTSLSIERAKDHAMYTDPKMMEFIKEHNIELVTYADLYKEYHK